MKIRTFASAFVLATAATFALTGVASAQPGDRDCPDFATQAEAQAALDSAAGDPERLDRNDNGIACEDHFAGEDPGAPEDSAEEEPAAEEPAEDEPATEPARSDDDDEQIAVAPRGGVDTGDGSGAGAPVALVVGFGAAGAAVVAGATAPALRRRS